MLVFVVGTRPELIKIAPLLIELKKRKSGSFLLINTAQHRELLDKYWKVFGITPDYTLDVISPNQDLSSLTTRAIDQLSQILKKIISEKGKPEFIISQGDTTTVLAAAMVSFYLSIPFAHVEAGLRSHDLGQPFPEEFNRRTASLVATIHFAPTAIAKQNLINENVSEGRIKIVGNTGIDALHFIADSDDLKRLVFKDSRLNELQLQKRNVVLITCHRRENHLRNLTTIIEAIDELSRQQSDISFVWPVHANPNVKRTVLGSRLAESKNVILTEPLDYVEMVKLLRGTFKVLTDSGGLQEEAPSFKIPVLILRDKTERPEAVTLGYSKLVGADKAVIIDQFYNFNPFFGDNFSSPYGDGKSSKRIIDVLEMEIKTREK